MTDTLYYDGRCDLCMREIARLEKLGGDDLALCDIHSVNDDTLPNRDELLKNLHLRTADDKLLTGVDANVAAWQHTRYGALFSWMQWPLIKPVASWCYERWALWRYNRLYGAGRISS
ncbi:MAG: DUF393 domain-containing protein [Halioglobus sp.]